MDKLNPANEPIGAATIATIIAWASAKFALGLDAGTATAIATVVESRQLTSCAADHATAA